MAKAELVLKSLAEKGIDVKCRYCSSTKMSIDIANVAGKERAEIQCSGCGGIQIFDVRTNLSK